MSQIIKNEDGTEQEVFTADELETQRQDAIETYKTEHPEMTAEQATQVAELDSVKKQLADAQEALAKGDGPNGKNFAALRGVVDILQKKVDTLEKSTTDKVAGLEGMINEDKLNEAITNLVGDDAELAKKVKDAFSGTLKGMEVKTLADFVAKVNNAYLLAAGKTPQSGAGANQFSAAGGAPRMKSQGGEAVWSPELIDLAKKMDITPEDIKKFG